MKWSIVECDYSTAYGSNQAQPLSLPPLTSGAVVSSQVRDLSTITELAKLKKRDKSAIRRFFTSRGGREPTRQGLKRFLEEAEAGKAATETPLASASIQESGYSPGPGGETAAAGPEPQATTATDCSSPPALRVRSDAGIGAQVDSDAVVG